MTTGHKNSRGLSSEENDLMTWNESYANGQAVTISADGMKTVTSPLRYTPGAGDLSVYYNGLYAVLGGDYKEISPFTIEFNYPLKKDDVVVFHIQKLW